MTRRRARSAARLLLLEFNELTPALLERFIADGALPNVAAFRSRSTRYVTTAGTDPLEPWIQWPTVHCGVPFAEHEARYVGDGRRIRQSGIATVLAAAGIRSGVFGGINLNYGSELAYYVPDAWEESAAVHPGELRPYFDVVAALVRENSKHALPPPAALLRFGAWMLANGLRARTVRTVLGQLAAERVTDGVRWRRAFLLDLVQYDVFRHLNRMHRVQFASFFSNSTAHLQHYYWRDMDPRGFVATSDSSRHPSLAGAVLAGYRHVDALLGEIARDYPDALLVFCTGLSQQPWFESTVCKYRPLDFDALLRFVGLGSRAVRPVMAERFRIDCATPDEAREVRTALEAVRLGERRLFGVDLEHRSVYAGCDVRDASDAVFAEAVTTGAGASAPFGTLFYRIGGTNTGKHHPEGALWIRNGIAREGPQIPLTSIAPAILEHFQVAPPPTMRGPRLPQLEGAARAYAAAT